MYGEAPDTVSVSITTAALLPGESPAGAPAGRFALTEGKEYVNFLSLRTLTTFVDIL